jgi:EAL domain-containing protein (putative c-di-GMP-specific phosphodiesterase class I)
VSSVDRRIVLGFSALEVLSDEARDALTGALAEYRGRGIGVSARDVGPGIEGLHQLARLSPDHAWLDPTLTRGLGRSFTAHSIAATVVSCAEEAGARVVADGIQEPEQLDELLALRVAMACGPAVAGEHRRGGSEHAGSREGERSSDAAPDADASRSGQSDDQPPEG